MHGKAISGDAPLPARAVAFAVLAIVANLFVVAIVNYWIYAARLAFAARHPELVSRQSVTISGSIADPAIGEPFAVAITIAALVLPFCAVCVFLLYRQTARALAPQGGFPAGFLIGGGAAMVLFQLGASAGMVMLANFRFPDATELHMQGSYLFFSAQALVVLTMSVLCGTTRRCLASAPPGVAARVPILARAAAARAVLGAVFACAAVGYLALFFLKDVAWPGQGAVHRVYVLWEPAMISGFLAVLALYNLEYLAMLGQALGRPGSDGAAGQQELYRQRQ